ncbi:MAG: fused MFS/spermidine synthase, partial [Deltaproteobacteria bacterium]|nr:fused MFS/spermidine synthase [Deltaproteobacteria bacterium]
LTVFMGGLGLGSYLAGKSIDRVKKPLTLVKMYGFLELMIGVYGLLLPLLLIAFRPLYAFLYNHLFSYFLGYNLITFIGCSILLLIPATCMGATLPILSRFFITSISSVGTHIGRLYGLNTIGAAFGSLFCGFWLINLFGVWGTLIFAVLLNTIIGLICMLAGKRESIGREILKTITEMKTVFLKADISKEQEQPEKFDLNAIYAFIIFAVSGFCAMAYEVIWIKLLGLIVGPTTYSFTIVLVTFITCLALGSLFFGKLADKVKNIIFLLLSTQIIAALFALFLSQVLGDSQIFFAKLIFHNKDNFVMLQLLKAAVLFSFMFLPTFCLGATFPLVGKICTRSLSHTGRSIGFAYAINTVGAVLGSFSAGFILIPFMGKENSIRLIVVIQLMTPFLITLHILVKKRKFKAVWVPLIALLLIGLFSISNYPRWNRKMLSTGKYHRFTKLEQKQIGWFDAKIFAAEETDEPAYFGDGIGGFTTVMKRQPDIIGNAGYALYNSGKADASSYRKDMSTQTLLAHFAMLFHKQPEDVLVLGLASGITSGEVLHYPVKNLDTIEINQQVVKASDFFIPWNNEVLSDPRTRLIIQDGRAHLELSNQKYDIIISEPSNPWMAGLASLFTDEFMKLAKNSLNENGIYVQWIHSYQMDWPTFSLVGRTFADVFPNSLLVTANPGRIGPDFLLVGFKNKYDLSTANAARNLTYAQKSKNMNLLNSRLFYNLIVSEDLQKLFGKGPINTDNNPVLEFSAPRLLHALNSYRDIAEKIISKSWITEKTKKIVSENHASIDTKIDYAAYLLSLDITLNDMADPTKMNSIQKERFAKHIIGYCSSNAVKDFSFISDSEIRRRAIRAHLVSVEKTLDSVSDKSQIYYYMGYHCLQNKMDDEALEYFSEAAKHDPENESTHFNIGYILSKRNNLISAISHFEESLRLKPDYKQANDLLKKSQASLKKIDNLIASVRKKMSGNQDNHLFHNLLAKLYEKKGDKGNAIAEHEKTLYMKPDFSPSLNSLALLYSSKKEYAKSISYFKRMIELHPDKTSLYYNIACLYSKQNKIQESVDWLRAAIRKGYNKWSLIKTDKDLDNIRASSGYLKIISDMQG